MYKIRRKDKKRQNKNLTKKEKQRERNKADHWITYRFFIGCFYDIA